jgi:hypothetical protein
VGAEDWVEEELGEVEEGIEHAEEYNYNNI